MHPLLLKNIALLKIHGADAADFLQGQLTNDVNLLLDSWHYSGYCSPKGRLLSLFAIWRQDDVFYALLSAPLVASVVPRLKMFVMRSKVEIEHLSNAKIVGVLEQSSNLPLANGESLELSANKRGRLSHNHGLFVLDMGARNLIVDPFSTELTANLSIDDEHQWLFQNIIAGLPSLQLETAEMFVPQMLNLDLLDGINFKKGCYTGQEIVARMHYLGKLKQRMFVCDAEPIDANAAAGTKVLTREGKNAGSLATPIVNGKCLAVLRLELVDQQLSLDLGLASQDPAVTLKLATAQPYQIEAI